MPAMACRLPGAHISSWSRLWRRFVAMPRRVARHSHARGSPDGRVGTKIAGWGVIRDDVLDAHPHGTIGMREGIVR